MKTFNIKFEEVIVEDSDYQEIRERLFAKIFDKVIKAENKWGVDCINLLGPVVVTEVFRRGKRFIRVKQLVEVNEKVGVDAEVIR